MKIYPEDNRFITEVIDNNEYGFLHHYPVVVDVGANIGTFSMWIYDHADKIYAIEPVAENITHLLRNVAKNNLHKIIIKQMALSDNTGIKTMATNGSCPEDGGWMIDTMGDYKVSCKTLNDFMKSENIAYIDLLKIDTEGHEASVLSSPCFPKDKIGTIIGELHGQKENPERMKVKELLEWYGYKYYEVLNNYFIARKI